MNVWLIGGAIYLLLCSLVGARARRLMRDPRAWFALSVLFSPLAGVVFLVVADVPYRAVLQAKERSRRRSAELKVLGDDVREARPFP